MAKKGGLLNAIKADVQKAGKNRGKMFYVKSGNKARIRFLEDMEDGRTVVIHDRWEPALTALCAKNHDEDADCPHCGVEGIRTRDFYCWSVWDYEASEVKIFAYPCNNCSPIPSLTDAYETYGSMVDRDFNVGRKGAQMNTAYTMTGLDKSKFRNEKAKPFSEKEFWKIINEAYLDSSADDDEDEDEKPRKKKTTKSSSASKKNKSKAQDDNDYEDMTARELYKLCLEREIKVKPGKNEDWYITKLEEADEDEDDVPWDDEDEEPDYSDMSAKELYNLCRDKDIEVKPKMAEKYYIKKLEEAEKEAEDDDFWDEDDED